MKTGVIVYICPMCFEVSDIERTHHGRRMIRCDAGAPGDERRKPVINGDGRLHSHAPRWFLEAIGSLPAQHVNRVAHDAVKA